MTIEIQIENFIQEDLLKIGYIIYESKVEKNEKNSIIKIIIFIQKKDKSPITITDCTKASKAISKQLDRHNSVLGNNYVLEVSSPGIPV
tara:strand:+ start:658 stop:924 length:267 start_codon:yes stop_codon:yes gene_type:complete